VHTNLTSRLPTPVPDNPVHANLSLGPLGNPRAAEATPQNKTRAGKLERSAPGQPQERTIVVGHKVLALDHKVLYQACKYNLE
jgi:hypothetical protein